MNDNVNSNQEQLTAFALNELDGAERAAVEMQLKNDEEARAFVDDVRATAALLEKELKRETVEDVKRALIVPSVLPMPSKAQPLPKQRSSFAYFAISIAALVMLAVVIWRSMEGGGATSVVVSKLDAPLSQIEINEKSKNTEEAARNAPSSARETPQLRTEVVNGTVSVGSKNSEKLSTSGGELRVFETKPQPAPAPVELKRSESFEKFPRVQQALPKVEVKDFVRPHEAEDRAKAAKEPKPIVMTHPRLDPNFPANPDKPKEKEKDAPKNPGGTVGGLVEVWRKEGEVGREKLQPSVENTDALVLHLEDHDKKEIDTRILSNTDKARNQNLADEYKDAPKRDGQLPGVTFESKPKSDSTPTRAFANQRSDQLVQEFQKGMNNEPKDFAKSPNSTTPANITPGINYNINGNKAAVLPNTPEPAKGPVDIVEKSLEDTRDNDAFRVRRGGTNFDFAERSKSPEPLRATVPPRVISANDWETLKKQFGEERINYNHELASANLPQAGPIAPTAPPTIQRPTVDKLAIVQGIAADEHANELAKVSNGTFKQSTASAEWMYRNDTKKDERTSQFGSWGATNYQFDPYTPPTPNGETYEHYPENNFQSARTEPLSTFSADVDTAAFANVRRFLYSNQLPPPRAVRIEELVNYFKYNYETIKTDDPFGANIEAAACPWNPAHRLVRVAIRAKDLVENKRPSSNLVFLIDVSGSMDAPNRLPLVKEGLKALVKKLGESDKVAIVTYAGNSGVALASTNCTQQERILGVIDGLRAEGSTNGGEGIQTAYKTAKENFIKGGVNRVILATDGDFNVGVTSPDELVRMVENESKSGVFLTALGYGMGNLKDATLQRLADKGNGNYAYIDTGDESRKVLIEQMAGTLVTVAKDVKFQVEFNPAQASQYRLIGYEKRALAAADFNNDAKDAGEVGAGHTVTAFYEIVPANAQVAPGIDGLKYQPREEAVAPPKRDGPAPSPELLTLKIRYKQPDGNESKKLEFAFTDKNASFEQASTDFKFAASVALFGQLLRHSQFVPGVTMRKVVEISDDNRGTDEGGYRREFSQMARKAAELRGER